MKKTLFAALASVALFAMAAAPPPPPAWERVGAEAGLPALLACSVTVRCQDGSGSGVAFLNASRRFVWTNAHVVASLREETRTLDKPNKFSITVTWKTCYVMQASELDGQVITKMRGWPAKVVRYDAEADLAVLEVSGGSYGSVSFGRRQPRLGEGLWLVGSPGGPGHSWSVYRHHASSFRGPWGSTGGPFYPGCSGGGLFDSGGRCVGLMTRYMLEGSHGIGQYVTAVEVRRWAAEKGCLWALDGSESAPDETGPEER